jgi:hypothetical protein
MNTTSPRTQVHEHADHGVRAFDADLEARRYHAVAQGAFRVLRTAHGRYYAVVRLHTRLGHVCAAVHLERASAESMLSTGAGPGAELEGVTHAADAAAARLEAAAAERSATPEVLRAACLLVRAHIGDQSARDIIRRTIRAARGGRPRARQGVRLLAMARQFVREVLGDEHTAGSFFSDLGHAISHAVRDVSHAARDVSRAVTSASHEVMVLERKAEKAIGPVLHTIQQWGPMILSDIHGLVSLIPGIGTGISAVLAAAEALLSMGSPLEIAIHLAYGAIPIPPGIRSITDVVLDTVLHFIKNPKHFLDVGLAVIRDRIPKGLPQEIFDTLVRIVVRRQPILKAGLALAGHYVEQYTKGVTSSLAKALPIHVPDVMHRLLAKLPDPKTAFKSIHDIAPHFTIASRIVPALLAHAQKMVPHLPIPAQLLHDATAHVQQAVKDHAAHAAALRLAHHAHAAPRLPPVTAPASLALEISVDGRQQRVVASHSLAHLIPTLSFA